MVRNVATLERVLRIVTGLMMLGLYGALDSPWRYLTLLGLLPLGSGLMGHCPVYHARDTRRTRP